MLLCGLENGNLSEKRFIGNQSKKDGWKLYDLEKDCSEMNDLSLSYSKKVRDLLGLFEKEAKRTFILPKK